jgi:AmmeMemoRadiSam system protein B
MHHLYPQALLTTAHQATPLPGSGAGGWRRQERLSERLKRTLGYGLSYIKHDPEHSLEIELPFLQRVFTGGFSLLPVMLRDQSPHVAQALGQALGEVLAGANALLVASTDLSHLHPGRSPDCWIP